MSQPSEELLKAQARFLDYPEKVYFRSSPKEREAAVEMFRRDTYLALLEQHSEQEANRLTEEKLAQLPQTEQQLVKTNSKEIRERKPRKPAEYIPELEDDDEPFQVQTDADGKEVRVYHQHGAVPPEGRPDDRDGPTVGPIKEREAPIDDLVGDRVPRTILDLYARWPIAEDSDYFIRLERMLPKRYNGLDVSGFVGEIRGKRISEADIQRIYGGKEYKATLYGPDPRKRGDVDADGRLKVKALTDPITITVPVLPPNLQALPLTAAAQETTMQNPMNPFAPVSVPTTPADAQIHKANASFFADTLKMQQQEGLRQAAESSKTTSQLIGFMNETNKSQLEQHREESRRREEALQKQLEDAKAQIEREKAAQKTVAAEVAAAKDKSSEALMQLYQAMGPDKQAEVQRITEYYRDQQDILRRAHADQMTSIQSRHEADLRRADERVKDTESSYRQMLEQERSQSRQMLDQERSQWAQRESDLRTQMDKQTDAERKMAQQRIDDMKERHSAELRSMEKAHERELRTIKEASDVKFSVAEQTHSMSLQHAQERYEDAKADLERARDEAEEAKDITSIMEKAEKQAELLGYEKKGANEPKTPWERLAATVGTGIAQAMGSANEWLPGVMAARGEAQAARAGALPPGAQQMRPPQQGQPHSKQQPQQRPPVRRRRTGAQWAAEGVQVRPQPRAPEDLPGFDKSASEPKNEQPQAVASPQSVPNPASGVPNSQEIVPVESNGQGREPLPFPPKFLKFFPEEALVGFLQQAEQAIVGHTPASVFADLMLGAYPDGARALAENFTTKEVSEAVEAIPGSERSPLLRRDGRKWMDALFKAILEKLQGSVQQPTTAPQ